MKLKLKLLFISIVSFSSAFAQSDDSVLFTVDGEPTYSSEFQRVYSKNLELLEDESQKDKKSYLDLFVNYKLKLAQAHELKYDTSATYQKELASYKEQLMEPYLRDDSVTDSLVVEAYNRSLVEINASHILVSINGNDTLSAYNKIIEARTKILEGKDFIAIAKEYSDDPSAQNNGGDLGYFTVFNMVYPFEKAAYATRKGEVSQPFRTRYGYHIIKVNDVRDALGEVEVAHIMVKGDSVDSETKINDIHTQLSNGEDFEYLAKTYSDDKYSSDNGGSLGKFGSGRMVKEFEDVSFSLENPGDVSKPFKTKFGWHIVKLQNKYPVKSFESSKDDLTKSVSSSDRSKIVSNSILPKLKKDYDVTVNEEALKEFDTKGSKESFIGESKILVSIQDEDIYQEDLLQFLKHKYLTEELWETYLDAKIIAHYKNIVENTDEEFIYTYKEYKEGLLLFELLQDKIWSKSKDSVGIQNYFEANKSDYLLNERVKAELAIATNKKSAKIARKLFKKGVDASEIKKQVNTEEVVNVMIKSGEFDNSDLPEGYELATGVSKVYETEEGRYLVISSEEVLPVYQQELDEVKGKVISDYQAHLEELWVEELHNTYKVEFHDEAVNAVLSE